MEVTTVAMAMMTQEHTEGGGKKKKSSNSHTSILKHGGKSPFKERSGILKGSARSHQLETNLTHFSYYI